MSQKPTVYVIDDDAAVRDSICLLLETTGFTVCSYASGAEFLREAPAQDSGCLLVDLDMPGMTGLDLLGQLRQRRKTIPAIIMTGGVTPTIRSDAQRVAAQVLEKPFRARELMGCIETALGRYRA